MLYMYVYSVIQFILCMFKDFLEDDASNFKIATWNLIFLRCLLLVFFCAWERAGRA